MLNAPANPTMRPRLPGRADGWVAGARRLDARSTASNHSFMLELRPTCEHCNRALPPDSLEARICSYECTFCASCVGRILFNVCPNCGGGFVSRPIRPSKNWKDGNFLGTDPASTTVKHRPVDLAAHAVFALAMRAIPPEKR